MNDRDWLIFRILIKKIWRRSFSLIIFPSPSRSEFSSHILLIILYLILVLHQHPRPEFMCKVTVGDGLGVLCEDVQVKMSYIGKRKKILWWFIRGWIALHITNWFTVETQLFFYGIIIILTLHTFSMSPKLY